jgi:hypothetical protein
VSKGDDHLETDAPIGGPNGPGSADGLFSCKSTRSRLVLILQDCCIDLKAGDATLWRWSEWHPRFSAKWMHIAIHTTIDTEWAPICTFIIWAQSLISIDSEYIGVYKIYVLGCMTTHPNSQLFEYFRTKTSWRWHHTTMKANKSEVWARSSSRCTHILMTISDLAVHLWLK